MYNYIICGCDCYLCERTFLDWEMASAMADEENNDFLRCLEMVENRHH